MWAFRKGYTVAQKQIHRRVLDREQVSCDRMEVGRSLGEDPGLRPPALRQGGHSALVEGKGLPQRRGPEEYPVLTSWFCLSRDCLTGRLSLGLMKIYSPKKVNHDSSFILSVVSLHKSLI